MLNPTSNLNKHVTDMWKWGLSWSAAYSVCFSQRPGIYTRQGLDLKVQKGSLVQRNKTKDTISE